MKRIVCFLCFLYVLLNVVSGQKNKTCADAYFKANPDMRDRFDDKQVQFLCSRADTWNQRVNSARLIAAAPPVHDAAPDKKLEWLQTVRSCRGSKCISDVVKCVGENCHEKKVAAPMEGLPPSDRGAASPVKPREPFPGYHVKAEDIAKYNVDDIDPEVLKGEQDDISSCEKRMWLANVCFMVMNSHSSDDAFSDNLVTYKKGDKDKMKQHLDDQYTKYKSKCDDLEKALTKNGKKISDVKPCSGITKPKSMDKKSLAEKCIQVLKAKTAGDAFPELKGNVTTTYAENILAQEYGQWLARCRNTRDKLSAQNQTFNDWINNSKFKRDTSPDPTLAQYTAPDTRAYRQEIRMLTDDQRQRYFNALNYLKNDLVDGTSKYDLLAMYHSPEDSPGAHIGAAFLPFHREYLKQVEVALRQVDPSVALSYWDSTLDNGLPNPKDSILWTPDFFGNGDKMVTTGPFANWGTTVELSDVPGMKTLYRNIGVGATNLYQLGDVDKSTHLPSFAQFTYCVNPTFEWVHGTVHNFVGGFMGDLGTAANDPCFYMHHCFIDYIWEEFRQNMQAYSDREGGYPDDSQVCNDNHKASATMKPFTITNVEGLSNSYADQLYYYQPRPTCSAASPTCSSPYLFCDTTRYRCLSKIKLNGVCTGFEGTDICYGGQCVSGTCSAS